MTIDFSEYNKALKEWAEACYKIMDRLEPSEQDFTTDRSKEDE